MGRKFTLTEENYHSRAARRRWISSSDVKAAKRCEAAWLADYCGKIKHEENKPAFAFGHLFEAALTLPGPQYHQYLAAHPELCSSRGPTKGQLRAEYAAAPELAHAVRRSPYLWGIVRRCKKQVILTGELNGMPVRCMMDLVDRDGSIYDLKAMRSFLPIYDTAREEYLDWWAYWNYPIQLYIYREIAHQNGLAVPRVGLIAASKADSDVQALAFGDEIMQAAAADTAYTMQRMAQILAGQEEPTACGRCAWCMSRKRITEFEMI